MINQLKNLNEKFKSCTYINRYGDKYYFSVINENTIKWSGNFKHCRYGFPNDYTKAYKEYCKNKKTYISLEQFIKDVFKVKSLNKYLKFLKSNTDIINMVDPSGGPYLYSGMEFCGKKIKEFILNKNKYLIILN